LFEAGEEASHLAQVNLLRSLRDKVEPDHTAILVVDMQNDFCSEGGFVHGLGIDLSACWQIVPNVQRLIEAARRHGVLIVHIRSHFDLAFLLPPMLERLERKHAKPYCVSGTWGAEFIRDLQPDVSDLVVTKHRYSGFHATDLDMQLRARGIQTVVLTGTATNNCVDGTGRDAFYVGYYVVMVSDATACGGADAQAAVLKTAEHAYAVIASVDEIVKVWEED
jgi:ureidoacrylate peracid hydrolase